MTDTRPEHGPDPAGEPLVASTMLHVRGATPEAVEEALTAIFAADDRPRVLRLEGTYSAVLARAADPGLKAAYRYLIFRAHDAPWVPVLEVGTRGEGLDVAISAALDGADVFSVFIYGDGLSGYRLARDGNAVDRYVSDPTAFASEPLTAEEIEAERGHPERFADLLPVGTTAEAFERVVLRQGWWEDYDAGNSAAKGAEATRGDAGAGDEGDEVDLVDEADRARCIALALELWGPSEYPFATDLEDLTNRVVGPALALAFE